jgi:hypothetical protein
MYAKVFATGGAARVDRVAAAGGGTCSGGGGSGFGVFDVGGAPNSAAAGVQQKTEGGPAIAGGAAGSAAQGAKQVSSGYMAGAMRELSLVALGGGGVVLRLEAYEMASMWDKE